MKSIAILFSLVVSILTVTAQAQIKDTDSAVSFEISNTKDARSMYQFLSLPIQWGDLVTGKPHQYKFFSDKNQAVTLYCDLINSSPRCILTLKKVESTDTTEVSHDASESRITLYDSQDAEPLFNAILSKGIEHGGYEIRALTDEALNYSISCMKDVANGSGTSCQFMIFKGNGI